MSPATRKPPPDALADEPAVVLDQVTHGFVRLDDAVIVLADAGRMASLAVLVARRIDLSADTVERALEASSPEPATLLCRAAGLGANGFSAVLRLRRRRLRDAGPSPAQALSGFVQTPVALAQQVVRMMKANEGR
jgi:Uncharacterised protein conserved in bacteria (DUF2336)